MTGMRPSVLGVHVDAVNYDSAVSRILDWARERRGHRVCVANVHVVMEAHDAESMRAAVNGADLVVPDGMPLVWVLRRLGQRLDDRVYGPTLTLRLCEAAAREGLSVGFFGARPEVCCAMAANLAARFPGLEVVFTHSPAFTPGPPPEDSALIEAINASGAHLLFVGLGCPKQEHWMAAHAGRIRPVMLGVGAAFDFHAGQLRQAPAWMQARGLEWLFRFAIEPRRLWRRYLVHNPRFVAFVLWELAHSSRGKPPAAA